MSRRTRRQMPVGLSPITVQPIIQNRLQYPPTSRDLSTFSFPTKAARAAGYLPNERRLISGSPSQSSSRIELNDASGKSWPAKAYHVYRMIKEKRQANLLA